MCNSVDDYEDSMAGAWWTGRWFLIDKYEWRGLTGWWAEKAMGAELISPFSAFSLRLLGDIPVKISAETSGCESLAVRRNARLEDTDVKLLPYQSQMQSGVQMWSPRERQTCEEPHCSSGKGSQLFREPQYLILKQTQLTLYPHPPILITHRGF